jgi:hypothetical protein
MSRFEVKRMKKFDWMREKKCQMFCEHPRTMLKKCDNEVVYTHFYENFRMKFFDWVLQNTCSLAAGYKDVMEVRDTSFWGEKSARFCEHPRKMLKKCDYDVVYNSFSKIESCGDSVPGKFWNTPNEIFHMECCKRH